MRKVKSVEGLSDKERAEILTWATVLELNSAQYTGGYDVIVEHARENLGITMTRRELRALIKEASCEPTPQARKGLRLFAEKLAYSRGKTDADKLQIRVYVAREFGILITNHEIATILGQRNHALNHHEQVVLSGSRGVVVLPGRPSYIRLHKQFE